ncbi:hypothetical protein PHYSODRAFT_548568 [Phytophthora sojae]|uniref:Pentacotripeptide-repeat region of PRORP domain-containing protein n=1 Tax=Phytophthora sojae (strain P6497) TaxID=1094619 RepID=G5A1I3_PHYSP|nr:hypothetical protein PHYSODRAFT_548568 [Phytophthora sojae]EGZ10781.1 hypothetical protein PHYSODRAFT_548568 [Phytophthora sojae]|eukprot:XP_009533526.1 hypothetical protein PHYSODRAFT_548568 [Phytophthora sojae]
MLCAVLDQGAKLSELTLRSLLIFADRANQPEIALEALAMMKDEGIEPTASDCNAVFIACGTANRWSDMIDVYESMPESFQSQLNDVAQTSVILARTRSERHEMKLRGLEIFRSDETKWQYFNSACMVALEALLETRQFDAVLTLADEMNPRKIRWSSFTCKMVALANMRSGSMSKARKILKKSKHRMGDYSVECYRELIEHYEAHQNLAEASAVAVEMMQKNAQVGAEDWRKVLRLAIQLPDHTSYWTLRELLRLHGGKVAEELPASLLLPEMTRDTRE